MNFRCISVYFVFILLVPGYIFAQENSSEGNNFFIDAQYHYGFVMPHHESIRQVVNRNVPGIEIRAGKEAFGHNIWEQLYCFPRIGLGYYSSGLGNDAVFGRAHSLFSFIDMPIFPRLKVFSLSTNLGFGVSYISKCYDSQDNSADVAIGSKEDVYFNLNLNSKFKIARNLELVSGVGFTHFSNGNTKRPNLGLNLVTASAGMVYFFDHQEPKRVYFILPSDNKKSIETNLIYTAGVRGSDLDITRKFFASSLSANILKGVGFKSKIGLGTDLFYDGTINLSRQDGGFDHDKKIYNYQAGVHLSYSLIYNKLSLMLQPGIYLYSKMPSTCPFYDRIGINYNLTEHLLANLSLKTILFKANVIEWGLGYRFKTAS